ncbi:MAG: helix-hairpin-helix domain-containing protein [Firmicutes bacterium]|nr:helix-hairpin-helix domain-containing protein [Bacillota bacterium]
MALVFLSLFYQGVRWKLGSSEVGNKPEIRSSKIAVEASEPITEERHCHLVHVNTAGMAELQTLPGIGPVFAERIIIERRERPFLEKRDLLRVAGIGEKRLAQIIDLICLYPEGNE